MYIEHVDPWSKLIDEDMNVELWEKAQNYFDFVYGREINEQITYHSCIASQLKQRKQKMVYQIYNQMKGNAG